MTTSHHAPPRTNNRLITGKDRPFEDWWHPIEAYLTGRSPVFKRFGLVGVAATLGNTLYVGPETAFMVAARGSDEGTCISGFVLDRRSSVTEGYAGVHFFEALLDTKDVKVAWRLAALLDNIFNCVPLDPEHQDDLERLLFAA
jgi:hypothetical protein